MVDEETLSGAPADGSRQQPSRVLSLSQHWSLVSNIEVIPEPTPEGSRASKRGFLTPLKLPKWFHFQSQVTSLAHQILDQFRC